MLEIWRFQIERLVFGPGSVDLEVSGRAPCLRPGSVAVSALRKATRLEQLLSLLLVVWPPSSRSDRRRALLRSRRRRRGREGQSLDWLLFFLSVDSGERAGLGENRAGSNPDRD
jgi:hypothetical protein